MRNVKRLPREAFDPDKHDAYSGHCDTRIHIPIYKMIWVPKGEPPPEKCPHCGRRWLAIEKIEERVIRRYMRRGVARAA